MLLHQRVICFPHNWVFPHQLLQEPQFTSAFAKASPTKHTLRLAFVHHVLLVTTWVFLGTPFVLAGEGCLLFKKQDHKCFLLYKILYGKFHQIKNLVTSIFYPFLANIVAFFPFCFPLALIHYWLWWWRYYFTTCLSYAWIWCSIGWRRATGESWMRPILWLVGEAPSMGHLYLINPAPSAASLTHKSQQNCLSQDPSPSIAICFFVRHACGSPSSSVPIPPPMHLHACF